MECDSYKTYPLNKDFFKNNLEEFDQFVNTFNLRTFEKEFDLNYLISVLVGVLNDF